MHRPRTLIVGLLFIALVVLAGQPGCFVGPAYQPPPEGTIPGRFDAGGGVAATQPASQPDDGERWWAALDDGELNALIERATAANLDLGIAVARLAQARSFRYVVAADWWPGVGFSGTSARSSGTDASRGGRVAGALAAATDTRRVSSISQVGGFDASWEIDLWGRVTHAVEAAEADAQAAAEIRNQVLLTITADVVAGYSHLRATRRRLQIAERNVGVQEQTVALVRRRVQLTLSNKLDLALAQRELELARAGLAPLAAEISVTQRQLAVLLGGDPQALYAELAKPADIPNPPGEAALGQPAELLRRRPDIRQAERQLAAASARVGVAVADFFPQINLTGALGLQSQGSWLAPYDWRQIFSVGPSIRWPLLDFGRLDAALQVQDWRTQEALLFYRRTMQRAIQDVDDSLGRFASERDRFEHLKAAVSAGGQAERLAVERYDLGVTFFLNVLDAQRQEYALEDQAAVSQEALVADWVAINKALGRGWMLAAPASEPPSTAPGAGPPIDLVKRAVDRQ